jgi:hypothetical protein
VREEPLEERVLRVGDGLAPARLARDARREVDFRGEGDDGDADARPHARRNRRADVARVAGGERAVHDDHFPRDKGGEQRERARRELERRLKSEVALEARARTDERLANRRRMASRIAAEVRHLLRDAVAHDDDAERGNRVLVEKLADEGLRRALDGRRARRLKVCIFCHRARRIDYELDLAEHAALDRAARLGGQSSRRRTPPAPRSRARAARAVANLQQARLVLNDRFPGALLCALPGVLARRSAARRRRGRRRGARRRHARKLRRGDYDGAGTWGARARYQYNPGELKFVWSSRK